MPELPEVETIVRSLRNPVDIPFPVLDQQNDRPGVVGRTIASAEIIWQRTLAIPDSIHFLDRIPGQEILSANRRGKFIVLELSVDWLLVHLRMSGDIRVEPSGDLEPQKHDRVRLNFVDKTRMVFNDPRKFGRMWLLNDPLEILGALGPEPLGDELSYEDFYQRLQRQKRALKPLLLDQTFLAGLGNIYSDEALHRARLHPNSRSNHLSFERTSQLLEAIRFVLEEGIRRNGASIDWVYRGGDFQNIFQVYRRQGMACQNCGTPVERIVVRQRGTHYCPGCQEMV